MQRFAQISRCQKYRYTLARIWEETLPKVLFVGLNPSTADAQEDDPTVRRCIRFAQDWGYGALGIVNVFAYRATDPSVLKKVKSPVGKENDAIIQQSVQQHDRVVLIWGNHAQYKNRYREVLKLIPDPYCLKINKSGQPAHPLYLPAHLQAIPFIHEHLH